MRIKINGLTPEQFLGLTNFLGSPGNIIKDAKCIDHVMVGAPNPPPCFAILAKSKSGSDMRTQDVVLVVASRYGKDLRSTENLVPAVYFMRLLQSMGHPKVQE